MGKSVEDYVRKCDPCHRRKEERKFVAPLGEVQEPKPLSRSHPWTLRSLFDNSTKNNYLITFTDNFTKYVETYPIPDQSAESCARVYATPIITRHGKGSTLITGQGRSFVSSFFKETCRILGIQKVNTSSYPPSPSNGMVERFLRSLHTGLSLYNDSANTNWDTVVSFYLVV